MSTQRDELAKVIVAAYGEDAEVECPCEQDLDVADAILAAGYRKPQVITTAGAIKELPALTMVVHDDIANGGQLAAYVVPDDGTVMFKDRYPFHLLRMDGEYINAEDMPLPLTVVYEVGAA